MNSLTMAFVANAKTNQLMFCSSFDGATWSAYVPIPMYSSTPPSLMVYNGLLWMAYVAQDTFSVVVCSSPDGSVWTAQWHYYSQVLLAPTLAVFNDRLWVTVVGIDNTVKLASYGSDGFGWGTQGNGQAVDSQGRALMSKSAVSLTGFKGQLWMGFEALDGRNSLVVYSSGDGMHWPGGTQVGQLSKTAPSLTVFNNQLWMAFVANNTTNQLLVCSSADGQKWSGNTPVGPASQMAPSLVAFNNQIWVAYVDGNATVMVASSSDGARWSGGSSIKESSKFAPSMLSNLPVFGRVRPLYKILTVIYAPPGLSGGQNSSQSSSYVSYSKGQSTGTSTSLSKSLQAGVSVTAGVGVDVGVVSLDASASFSASQSKTNTSTLDVTNNSSYKVTVYAPGADGIDHSQDLFYLWLNPAIHVQSDHTGNVKWNLGMDGVPMKIQYVSVEQLKNPSLLSPGTKQLLDAAGLTEADYDQILSTNPFANGATTIDPQRYVLTTQTIPYEPPAHTGQPNTPTTEYDLERTVAQGANLTGETDYTVSLSATAGVDLGVVSASVSVTGSFGWTDTSSYGTSSTSSQSATAFIGGPSYGYNGPTDIQVYWDTVYNSFMFAFVNPGTVPSVTGSLLDTNGVPAANTPVKLTVGGETYTTLTGRDGQYRIYGAPAGQATVSAGAKQMSVSVTPGQAVAPLRLG